MSYDLYWIYTPQETEGTTEFDHPIGEQIPYCEHWQAVRKVSYGHEPTSLLGYQQWPLQDFMGEPSVFSDFESTEGTDASNWWEWNS